MNRFEILDVCYSLFTEDVVALRNDLNILIDDHIKELNKNLKTKDNDYWNEVRISKNLEDTLADRLEEIKELKKNG